MKTQGNTLTIREMGGTLTVKDLTNSDYINYINTKNWDDDVKTAAIKQLEDGSPFIRFTLCKKVVAWLNTSDEMLADRADFLDMIGK